MIQLDDTKLNEIPLGSLGSGKWDHWLLLFFDCSNDPFYTIEMSLQFHSHDKIIPKHAVVSCWYMHLMWLYQWLAITIYIVFYMHHGEISKNIFSNIQLDSSISVWSRHQYLTLRTSNHNDKQEINPTSSSKIVEHLLKENLEKEQHVKQRNKNTYKHDNTPWIKYIKQSLIC